MVYSGGDACHLCRVGHFRPPARWYLCCAPQPASRSSSISRVRRTGQQGRLSLSAGRQRRHQPGAVAARGPFTLGSHTRPAPTCSVFAPAACLPAFHAEITWIFVAATIVAVFVAYGERLAPLVQGPVQPAGTPRLLTGTQLRQCASACSGPPFTAKPPRFNEPTIGILPACGTQRAHNGGSRSVCRHWC
jgi:hypothetical protein